jgi:acetyltransferase-like isoleucine patch superfamily enzyme
MSEGTDRDRRHRVQHRRRLSHMPWLYFRLKPVHQAWARAWQARIRERLMALETVEVDPEAFVAPEARIFAEPGRTVRIGPRSYVAAGCFVHGPVELDADVSLNVGVHLDGGARGIRIGDGTRVAHGASLVAFDHGMALGRPIREQPVRSRGIGVGRDVWIGDGARITDGAQIADGAVVAMGAVVTGPVAAGTVVAGVPARRIGRRSADGWVRD